MDPTVNYYVTTLTTAFKNIAHVAAFIIGGYFVFVKLPFLFLKKSMDDQKKKLQEENKDLTLKEEKYSVEDYKKFQRQMKLINGQPEKPVDKPKVIAQPEPKKQEQQKKTEEKKREEKRTEQKRPEPQVSQTPEEVLGFRPNATFTKSELKKRYLELLKQNHPDRVASMGPDFKNLAEKNTKEINKAYDKLKGRAS